MMTLNSNKIDCRGIKQCKRCVAILALKKIRKARMVKRTSLMINFNLNKGSDIPLSLQMLAPDADWDPKGLSTEN